MSKHKKKGLNIGNAEIKEMPKCMRYQNNGNVQIKQMSKYRKFPNVKN